MNKDQERHERAYKIWEEEGRPDGQHDDHWNRAEDEHERTEREASDITDANKKASDEFNGGATKPEADIRPPSTVGPD